MSTKTAKRPQASGLGLDSIGDLSMLLSQPEVAADAPSGPLELALNLIDEDPNQPRHADNPGFSRESLEEMAETIRTRGVKTPISVRPHPEADGRYIINHGARRYRASKIAGKETIPAFVDPDYTEADQVIENLQRNDLTPREIADFIGRELAKGKKKSDIAKEIGKSPAFVTQHVTLLDLPDPIAEAFNTGRAKDVTVINEMVMAYKKAPDEVTTWLSDESQELTRGSVKLLREFLDDKRKHAESNQDEYDVNGFAGQDATESEEGEQSLPGVGANEGSEPKVMNPDRLKKAIVQVQHNGRPARLILNRRPNTGGWAWLKYDDGQVLEADLSQVQLVAVIEG